MGTRWCWCYAGRTQTHGIQLTRQGQGPAQRKGKQNIGRFKHEFSTAGHSMAVLPSNKEFSILGSNMFGGMSPGCHTRPRNASWTATVQRRGARESSVVGFYQPALKTTKTSPFNNSLKLIHIHCQAERSSYTFSVTFSRLYHFSGRIGCKYSWSL